MTSDDAATSRPTPSGKRARQQRLGRPGTHRRPGTGGAGGSRQASGRTLAVAGGVILLVSSPSSSASCSADEQRRRTTEAGYDGADDRDPPGTRRSGIPPARRAPLSARRREAPQGHPPKEARPRGSGRARHARRVRRPPVPLSAQRSSSSSFPRSSRSTSPKGEAEDRAAALERSSTGPRTCMTLAAARRLRTRRRPGQGVRLRPGPLLEPGRRGTDWMNNGMISKVAGSVDGLKPTSSRRTRTASATQRIISHDHEVGGHPSVGDSTGTPTLLSRRRERESGVSSAPGAADASRGPRSRDRQAAQVASADESPQRAAFLSFTTLTPARAAG